MLRRAFNIATIVSIVWLALAIALFAVGFFLNPWDHRLSLTDGFHVALWGRGIDSRVVLFNDAEYGPYRGSIIGITDAEGNLYPPLDREVAFGDSWGIYCRYFQWSDAELWTLMATLWYPIALFAILPATHLLWRLASRRPTSSP